MISVEAALSRLLALVEAGGVETAPLAEAAGRVLRAPVIAARDQPPFPASAMDGYAVRAAEAQAGARLRVAGEAAAGARYAHPLGAGEAVRIFTGAPVPEGADAILIQENADRDGDIAVVREATEAGRFIRPAGLDFRLGAEIAPPLRLRPSDIALAAAMGAAEVTVARRPTVVLIPTGDELVAPGAAPGPDQIVSSTAHGLAAEVAALGGIARIGAIARDNAASLDAALADAEGADFIVALGGASVGDHDLVRPAFAARGAEMEFQTVAMRPGKPLNAGRMGGSVVIGLPGNPVSAMVCGRIFLAPALLKALGFPPGPAPRATARLAAPLGPNGPREHYMRASLREDGATRICAPFGDQDSSRLGLLAGADALVIRPPHDGPREAGDQVEVVLLS